MGKIKGIPPTIDNLREIAGGAYNHFVWPTDPKTAQPLLIDALTAGAMVAVYDKLSEKNQNTFVSLDKGIAKNRVKFFRLAEFCLSKCTIGGK